MIAENFHLVPIWPSLFAIFRKEMKFLCFQGSRKKSIFGIHSWFLDSKLIRAIESRARNLLSLIWIHISLIWNGFSVRSIKKKIRGCRNALGICAHNISIFEKLTISLPMTSITSIKSESKSLVVKSASLKSNRLHLDRIEGKVYIRIFFIIGYHRVLPCSLIFLKMIQSKQRIDCMQIQKVY